MVTELIKLIGENKSEVHYTYNLDIFIYAGLNGCVSFMTFSSLTFVYDVKMYSDKIT